MPRSPTPMDAAPEGYDDRQIDRFCEDVITRFLDADLGK